MIFNNKFLAFYFLIFMSFLGYKQCANSWSHLHSGFRIYNNSDQAVTIYKTHAYQMDVDSEQSAFQVIKPRQYGYNIDFWAQFQNNNFDYDDGMNFSISLSDGSKIGAFTIKPSSNQNGMSFSIDKNSANVYLLSEALVTVNPKTFYSTIIYGLIEIKLSYQDPCMSVN